MDGTTFYNALAERSYEFVIFAQPAPEKQIKELLVICPELRDTPLIEFLTISNGLLIGGIWALWSVEEILDAYQGHADGVGFCDVLINNTVYYWQPAFIYTPHQSDGVSGRYDIICQTTGEFFDVLFEHRADAALPVRLTVP